MQRFKFGVALGVLFVMLFALRPEKAAAQTTPGTAKSVPPPGTATQTGAGTAKSVPPPGTAAQTVPGTAKTVPPSETQGPDQGAAAGHDQKPEAGSESQPFRDLLRRIGGHPWWTGLVVVVLLLGIGFLLYHASRSAMSPFILQLGPSFFFWLGVIYLILLLLCVPVYSYCYGAANRSTPFLIAGILPVPVPWFGALGAVVISLEGVFMWNTRWDKAFNYWHIGRPLFGAVLGMVAFFLFVCIVTASGNQPPFLKPGQPPGQQQNAGDFIIYYVVAFLVGYREQTFRELIKRATDLILQPGTPAPPAPDVTFRVDGRTKLEIPFPAPGENQKVSNVVEVMNSGTAPLQNPKVTLDPPEPAGWFALVKEKDLVSSGGSLAPGQTRTVEVSFTPKEKKPFSAELIVTADNLPNPKKIRLSGTVTS